MSRPFPPLLFALLAACASPGSRAEAAPPPEAPAGAVVQIETQSASRVDVYVLGNAGRIRLRAIGGEDDASDPAGAHRYRGPNVHSVNRPTHIIAAARAR